MVARTQWAIQFLQGSVETLFWWGGKLLHHFIANLFRKPCIKFHENCLRFVWDIPKYILVSFFLDTLYVCEKLWLICLFVCLISGRRRTRCPTCTARCDSFRGKQTWGGDNTAGLCWHVHQRPMATLQCICQLHVRPTDHVLLLSFPWFPRMASNTADNKLSRLMCN